MDKTILLIYSYFQLQSNLRNGSCPCVCQFAFSPSRITLTYSNINFEYNQLKPNQKFQYCAMMPPLDIWHQFDKCVIKKSSQNFFSILFFYYIDKLCYPNFSLVLYYSCSFPFIIRIRDFITYYRLSHWDCKFLEDLLYTL